MKNQTDRTDHWAARFPDLMMALARWNGAPDPQTSAEAFKAIDEILAAELAARPVTPVNIGFGNEGGRSSTATAARLSLPASAPEALTPDAKEDAYVIDRFSKILAGVAIALKGDELPLHRHSYHDLVEVATAMKLEIDLYRSQGAPEALSDEQIDKALEAWFANGPVGIEHKTDRTRMRAAIAALAAPSTPAAGEAWVEDEDLEAVIACLGDDAATLHNVNPEDEVADNMLRAVVMLERLRTAPSTPAAATPVRSSDAEVSRYWELLYAVERKHHGETRHQTALRYIRQAERGAGATVAATQAQAPDHTEQALGMVLSDAEIEKEAGNRVGGMSYKVGFIEGANFARGRTP